MTDQEAKEARHRTQTAIFSALYGPQEPAKKEWTFYEVRADSSEKTMDDYFAEKHGSYKQYGAVGDVVRFGGMDGEYEGTVTKLNGNERVVETEKLVAFQTWCCGKFWFGNNVGNKAAIQRICLPE